MTPKVQAVYDALLTHGAGCLACREFRDEDGKSIGQCAELDVLAEEYRRVLRDSRKELRATRFGRSTQF